VYISLRPLKAAHTVLDTLIFFNTKEIVSANCIAAGLNATKNKQTKSNSKCPVLWEYVNKFNLIIILE
jgi:hypothetical protein